MTDYKSNLISEEVLGCFTAKVLAKALDYIFILLQKNSSDHVALQPLILYIRVYIKDDRL